MADANIATLLIRVLLEYDGEQGVEKLKRGLGDVDTAAKRTQGSTSTFQKSVQDMGKKLTDVGDKASKLGGKLTKGLTLPIVGFATGAAKAAIDFESAFAGVQKTVDATAAEYKEMADEIIRMSERMPFAATEIAGVAEAAGQLGIAKEDVLAFSEVMLKMGQATDLAGEEAATQLARFANITGLAAADYDKLGSSIVALGNNFAATESEIVALGMRLASAGDMAGLSQADIMGFSAALRSVGVEAEAGGTAFSKVMIDIDTAADKGGKAIEGFAKVAGMSGKDFAKLWEEDAATALTKFIEGLGQVEAAGGSLAGTIEDLGFAEVRTRDTLMRAAGASDMVARAVQTANEGWKENIALQEEVDKRNQTTEARMTMLKNKLVNTGAEFGKALLPALEQGMEAVAKFVDTFRNMDDSMRTNILFAGGIAAAIGPTVKAIGVLTKSVGGLMKAFSFTKSHPSILAFTVLAAAIGGIIYALGAARREAEKFKEEVTEFDLNLDESNVKRVQDKINEGKEQYTVYANVKLEFQQKADELWHQLDSYMADGKFTKSEGRKFTRSLNNWVEDSVKEASTYAEKGTAQLRETLEKSTIGGEFDTSLIISQVVGMFTSLATDLSELEFLTPDQIDEIIRLSVDPGVKDLNSALESIGIIDPEAQDAIISAVKPNVTKLNRSLEDMGILDETTRSTIISKVMQQVSLLSGEIGSQTVDPASTFAIASLLVTFASEADKKLIATGIPILQDEATRTSLINAAMKGPNELKAALANQKLFTENDRAIISGILDTSELQTAINDFDPLNGFDKEAFTAKWNSSLEGLTSDIGGMTTLSEKQINKTVGALETKAKTLISEIETLEAQVTAITQAATSENRALTEAELARVQELMAGITELQTQIRLLGDASVEYAASAATVVKAGQGNEDTFGVALGYEKSKFDNEFAQIKADTLAKISELKEMREAAQKVFDDTGDDTALKEYLNKIASIEASEVDQLASLKETYVSSIVDLFDGIAKAFPEEAAKLEGIADNYNALEILQTALSKEGGLEKGDYTSIFTPEIMKEFFDMDMSEDEIASMFDNGMLNVGWIDSLQTKLMEKMKESMESMEGSPLLELLKGALSGGDLDDLADVDMSSVTGALESLFKLMDFKDSGGDIGKNLVDSIGTGVTENQETAKTAITTSAGEMIKAAKTAFGIASPSKEFYNIGRYLMAGLHDGLAAFRTYALLPLNLVTTEMSNVAQKWMEALANGLEANKQTVIDKMTAIANEAVEAAMNVLQNFSPASPAMATFGADIGGFSAASASVVAEDDILDGAGHGTVVQNITINAPRGLSAYEYVKVQRQEANDALFLGQR